MGDDGVRREVVALPRPTPTYSPRKTSTVPATIRPTLKALRICPIRF